MLIATSHIESEIYNILYIILTAINNSLVVVSELVLCNTGMQTKFGFSSSKKSLN